MILHLSEKLPSKADPTHLYALKQFLGSQALNLDVEIREVTVLDRGWIRVVAEGEDVGVFSSSLEREIGLVLGDPTALTPGESLKGFVEGVDEGERGLLLDVGVGMPRGMLELGVLRAQLADGNAILLARISEAYCLKVGLPLRVTVQPGQREGGEGSVEVRLSSAQIKAFEGWASALLDRVVVLGEMKRRVKKILAETMNLRNITEIERLGLFAQMVPCKIGLDSEAVAKQLKGRLGGVEIGLFRAGEVLRISGRSNLAVDRV